MSYAGVIEKKSRFIRQSVVRELHQLADKRCQKCGSTGFLEIHHIHGHAIGGSNQIENLSLLCNSCHRLYHSRFGRRATYKDFQVFIGPERIYLFQKPHVQTEEQREHVIDTKGRHDELCNELKIEIATKEFHFRTLSFNFKLLEQETQSLRAQIKAGNEKVAEERNASKEILDEAYKAIKYWETASKEVFYNQELVLIQKKEILVLLIDQQKLLHQIAVMESQTPQQRKPFWKRWRR